MKAIKHLPFTMVVLSADTVVMMNVGMMIYVFPTGENLTYRHVNSVHTYAAANPNIRELLL
jgi:hypothetical protein